MEIKKIDPPKDIMEAMSKQMKAERTKRAAILEAEGVKQAQILKAEGERNAAILRAEGEAEAIRKVAEANKYKLVVEAQGQAQAIMEVFRAIHEGKPNKEIITLKYLEALAKISEGQATKIFLPYDASSILAGLGVVSEVFKKT